MPTIFQKVPPPISPPGQEFSSHDNRHYYRKCPPTCMKIHDWQTPPYRLAQATVIGFQPQQAGWGRLSERTLPRLIGLSTDNTIHKSRKPIRKDLDGQSKGVGQLYDTDLTGTRKPNNVDDKIEVWLLC